MIKKATMYIALSLLVGMGLLLPTEPAQASQCSCSFTLSANLCEGGSFTKVITYDRVLTGGDRDGLKADIRAFLLSKCEDVDGVERQPDRFVDRVFQSIDRPNCEATNSSGRSASHNFRLACEALPDPVPAGGGCYCQFVEGGHTELIPEFSANASLRDACAGRSGGTTSDGTAVVNCAWKAEAPVDPVIENAQNKGESQFTLPSNVSSLNRFSNTGAQGTERAQVVIGRVIRFLIGIIGSFALIVLIVAGVLWMTAGGNADREKKAKEIMFWGVLGIISILGSFALVDFILQNTFVQ